MGINWSYRRLRSSSAGADGVVTLLGILETLAITCCLAWLPPGLLHLSLMTASGGGRPVEADRETGGGGFSRPQSPRQLEIQ